MYIPSFWGDVGVKKWSPPFFDLSMGTIDDFGPNCQYLGAQNWDFKRPNIFEFSEGSTTTISGSPWKF